jgi:cytochrome c-type biogenesis protein
MGLSQLGLGAAFLAGLLSFVSPCMLPLVPIYLAQLVGQSVYQSTDKREQSPPRLVTFLHALLFVVGFTLVFVALGATASALGSLLRSYQVQLREIGGVILILIGLHLAGILKIPFLYWQKRMTFVPSRPSYPTSLLIGAIFAIGWTPCISVLLGTILGLASQAATLREGVLLLLVYSLGMGLPFLLLGLGLDQCSRFLKWLKPHLGKIEILTGVILVCTGLLIYFNVLASLNSLVPYRLTFSW